MRTTGEGKNMRRVPVGRFTAGDWRSVPDQTEASSSGGGEQKEDMEEVEERNGILFNFCQSRREEDNSQTGMT